ncbi:NAD(+) diphosphatase [Fonticella tunisiensis]|uniref:NAD(+) diphosphatase n=1 Tax=Fonticella tunisiensis TaxID=1096341 RepID=A0A4V3EU16_9CLOT|nr:NAD(+) diphosphatase [Fonticella tunisiensis]TDT61317.1 NAD+ diphosphatase [Fonticella tunisiensis]
MIESGDYLRFVPGFNPDLNKNSEDMWFILNGDKILVKIIDSKVVFPNYEDVCKLNIEYTESEYIGTFDSIKCFAADASGGNAEYGKFVFKEPRFLLSILDQQTFSVCSRAMQIINWDRTHKYCGRCGSLNERKSDERAKICPNCGFTTYPSISPAIIVAIVKDDQILLAHNRNFSSNMYSVIAGFLEYGEVFEDCVRREVAEEVGIRVKNIKYFGSQPWPFPNSFMVAFTAEYDGGEIEVDGVEISDAGWYRADELPCIPAKGSAARKLIDWFVENYS